MYDVCHNIAKFETCVVDGAPRRVLVHRKGATRAYPPGHPQTPAAYREVGQPVLVPGDMGRYSYVLVGTDRALAETFGSTCHGAGRVMSRTQAAGRIKKVNGRRVRVGGVVDWDAVQRAMKAARIELRGSGADAAGGAKR